MSPAGWLVVHGVLGVGGPTVPESLERAVEGLVEHGLVAVDPEDDCAGCWCKRGKPSGKSPIRDGAGSDGLLARGKPLRARTARLRERECADIVFRVRVTEWEYPDEASAARAARGIARANHNSPALKSVHRVWSHGRLVFFAHAGSFAHWDVFVTALARAGVAKGLCDHR